VAGAAVTEAKAAVTEAKAEILRRVRTAGKTPTSATPRDYRRTGTLEADARIGLFAKRVADYRAKVVRVLPHEVAGAVADACSEHGAARIVVPPGLPQAWRAPALELVEDRSLITQELDGFDGVISGCTVAIAETGTIVLGGGPTEGRRALSLVPDLHVCVVLAEQIVELVPEAIAQLDPLVARERRPLTFISGPSATSDIELKRIEGVHGPRTLVVLIVVKENS
jgi:L-lactate dehydrogenase complex protein LldG